MAIPFPQLAHKVLGNVNLEVPGENKKNKTKLADSGIINE